MKKITAIFVVALSVMVCFSCGHHHEESEHEHETEEHHHDHDHECDEHHHHAHDHEGVTSATAITFTHEQAAQVDFAVDTPQLRPFGPVVRTVAQVQPAQGDEVTVVAKANGVMTFTSSNIWEGSSISKGVSVARISSDGMVSDNLSVMFSEAKNNYETAKQNYERAKSLVDSKIISQAEFLELKNTYENARLVYENLQRNVNAGGSAVISPLSGYIKQIFVSNGSYVSVGQPIMSVSQNHNLVLKADVSQRYAAALPVISSVNIENPVTHEVSSLDELGGRVISYGRTVSGTNFMLPVTMEMKNVGDFTPGMLVKVWFSARTTGQALTVPKSSLIEEQGNYYVFVQVSSEQFEKKEVRIGADDGVQVEILSGITSKQRIVTRGAVYVKLAKASGALDPHAGHVH